MATKTSTASGNWSTGTTWVGGVAPVDGDDVVIDEGHAVLMETDTSAYTGLHTITIKSSNSTPGMLYFTNGTDGYLKLAAGYYITGDATGSNKGRILANSDGVWGNTGELSNSNEAIIDLNTSGYVDAQYLDIALYASTPSILWTWTYGTKYDFNAATAVDTGANTIDLGTTPPSNGTQVLLATISGTLPGGLYTDVPYYIRGVSGNTCQLAEQNSDSYVVDITSVGSGTVSIINGYSSGSPTVNTYHDLTTDSHWSTTANKNDVYLCDSFVMDTSQDRQTSTLSSIGSTSVTMADNVDSTQNAGAKLYLIYRNVQIRTSTNSTAFYVVRWPNNTPGYDGVFNCLMWSANTRQGRMFFYGYNVTVDSCIVVDAYAAYAYGSTTTAGTNSVTLGVTMVVYSGGGMTINGIVDGSYYVFYGAGTPTMGANSIIHAAVYICQNCYFATAEDGARLSGNYIIFGYGSEGANYTEIIGNGYPFYGGQGRSYADIRGCTYSAVGTDLQLFNCSLGAAISYDLSTGGCNVIGYGASLTSNNPVVYTATTYNNNFRGGVFLYDVGGDIGQVWSHNSGGLITTEAAPATPPVTLPYAYKFDCSRAYNNHILFPLMGEANKLLRIKIYEKCNSAPSTFANTGPKFQIIDPAVNPASSTAILAEVTAETHGGDDTSWHTINLEYRPQYTRPLQLRIYANDGTSKYFHTMFEIQNASSYALQFRGV